MYKVLTENDKNYILNNPNKTTKELSIELGINYRTVCGFRNSRGILSPKTSFNPNREEFIDLYTNRKSMKSLEEFYGVNRHTINYFAKKIGVHNPIEQILNSEQIRDIESRYYSDTAIALSKEYNCSQSKITQIWSKAGLKNKQVRKYRIDETYFDSIDSGDKAYFLGFIAADGCIYNPNDKQDIIRISIQRSDIKVLELFARQLKTDKPIYDDGYYTTLEISSQRMVDNIINLGISYNKTYGNTIANIPNKYMTHYIRGYFDGDGSIMYNGDLSRCRINISGFTRNLEKIKEYLESINILSCITIDRRNYHGGEEFGAWGVSNTIQRYSFVKAMYENCGEYYMDRKHALAMQFIEHIENSKENRNKQAIIYYNNAVHGRC